MIQLPYRDTSMTHLIYNCALYVILSSALPLLVKVLGKVNNIVCILRYFLIFCSAWMTQRTAFLYSDFYHPVEISRKNGRQRSSSCLCGPERELHQRHRTFLGLLFNILSAPAATETSSAAIKKAA